VDTLLAGAADAGPLDAWWHALFRRYEPVVAARLRVVARTPATPMPFLVCSADLGDTVQRRLATALDAAADAPELAPVRDALLLTGFARVDADAYALLARRADEIDSMGYPRLQ
jgi:ABC-type phosphate/phosphonate transport system substrate-binding protein